MLAGTGAAEQYAQTGYLITRRISVNTIFAQWSKPDGSGIGGTVTAGQVTGTNTYVTNYIPTAGTVEMYIISPNNATTYLAQLPYNFTSSWQHPIAAQWDGETLNEGDDMPGTSSNHAHFTGVQDKGTSDGFFGDPGPLNVSVSSDQPWRYSFTTDQRAGNTRYFDIWTNP